MPDYKVNQGDCIKSIALEYGLFWETIWNHSNNEQLRLERKNPNVLLPGDKVFVPKKRIKEDQAATEKRHCFKRKGVPSKLQILLRDESGQPRPNLSYTLEVDGELLQGKTSMAGELQHSIPANARRGKVIVHTDQEDEEYLLHLGHLDPHTEISGLQARLNNLGFECGLPDGIMGPETREAIRAFQAKHGLKETREPDDPTRQKLQQEHGS